MTDQPNTLPAISTTYLATVALEPNRWKRGEKRVPTVPMSHFSPRARTAGFAGWELWEDHYHLVSEGEQAALIEGKLPVRVFNTYFIPGVDEDSRRAAVNAAITAFGSNLHAVKFNLGKTGTDAKAQIAAALVWANELPAHVRLLCECHPGTVIEEPKEAAKAFRQWPAERFGAIVHPLSKGPEKLQAWFDALPGRIEHLHIQTRQEDTPFVPVQELESTVRTAWEVLRNVGFRGTAAMEFVSGIGQPHEAPASLLEQAISDFQWLRAYRFLS